MTPQELTTQLGAGRIDPIYLVVGEESLLIDQALAEFRRYASAPDDLMNTHLFSGAEVSPAHIAAIAQTLPACAPRRLVLVRDAERLAASDTLTEYFADPAPTTCLVFVMSKPDRRKSWVQALVNRAATVTCDPLKPAGLRAWLQREAATRGVSLSEDAVAYLLARADGSLRALLQDLEKLALSRPQGCKTSAGIDEVVALSPGAATISVFDWAHAVAMGRVTDAVASAHQLVRDEAPLLLLSILAGQWRKMIRYRALVDQGVGPPKASHALGLPPFAAARVSESAQRRSLPELIEGLTWCLETDAAIKGGALAPALAIERLVLALCRRAQAPSGRTVTGAWWPRRSARGQAIGVAGQARHET